MVTQDDRNRINTLVDGMLLTIDRALEASGLDLEFETTNGILEIEFPSGTKVIINRQTTNREISVAARWGRFHFRGQGDLWIDTRSGKSLLELL